MVLGGLNLKSISSMCKYGSVSESYFFPSEEYRIWACIKKSFSKQSYYAAMDIDAGKLRNIKLHNLFVSDIIEGIFTNEKIY